MSKQATIMRPGEKLVRVSKPVRLYPWQRPYYRAADVVQHAWQRVVFVALVIKFVWRRFADSKAGVVAGQLIGLALRVIMLGVMIVLYLTMIVGIILMSLAGLRIRKR
jgi:hypothetical protein